MRFVKIAAAQWIASARPSASAWLETSMTQCVSPASRIAANAACRSIASGVVRSDLVLDAPDDGLHGPEQPGRLARGLEQRAHEVGARRLAVGPGDADRLAASRSGRRGSARRRAPSPPRTSSTTTSGTPSASGWSTTSATAPRATASAAKSCPSRVNPRTQKKSRAGLDAAVVERERGDLDVGRVVPEELAQRH